MPEPDESQRKDRNARRGRLALVVALTTLAIVFAAYLASIKQLPGFLGGAMTFIGMDDDFRRNATSSGLAGALLLTAMRFGGNVWEQLQRYVAAGDDFISHLLAPVGTVFFVTLGIFVAVPAAAGLATDGGSKHAADTHLANPPAEVSLHGDTTGSAPTVRVDWGTPPAVPAGGTVHIDAADLRELKLALCANRDGGSDVTGIADAIDRLNAALGRSLSPATMAVLRQSLTTIADRVDNLSPHTVVAADEFQ